MQIKNNIKPFQPKSTAEEVDPISMQKDTRFLATVEDWSMCEPFNKDDIIQIVRKEELIPGNPAVIEKDGVLSLCLITEAADGTFEISYAAEPDVHDTIENFRPIGTVAGIFRG